METNSRDELFWRVRLLRADAIDATNPRYELDVAVVQKHKLVDMSQMLLDILLGSRTATNVRRDSIRPIAGSVGNSLLPLPYKPQQQQQPLQQRATTEADPQPLVRPVPANKPVPINALLRRTNGALLPLPASRPPLVQQLQQQQLQQQQRQTQQATFTATRPIGVLTIEEMDVEPAALRATSGSSPSNRMCDANDNHLARLSPLESNPNPVVQRTNPAATEEPLPAGARTPVPSSPQYASLDDSPAARARSVASVEPVAYSSQYTSAPAPQATAAATATTTNLKDTNAPCAPNTAAISAGNAADDDVSATSSSMARRYMTVHQIARLEREREENERLQAERTLANSDNVMVAHLQQIVSLPYVRPTTTTTTDEQPIEVIDDDNDSDLVLQRVERVSQPAAASNRAHISARRSAPNAFGFGKTPASVRTNLSVAIASATFRGRSSASNPGTPIVSASPSASSASAGANANKKTMSNQSQWRGRRPPPKRVRRSIEDKAMEPILLSDVEDGECDEDEVALVSFLRCASSTSASSSAAQSPHNVAAAAVPSETDGSLNSTQSGPSNPPEVAGT